MLKLNNKGYLAVEVILASVVAVSIAIFLIDLTVKMVNKTNDNYINTLFLNDKALITNNLRKKIKEDIVNSGPIQEVTKSDTSCSLKFGNDDASDREIAIYSTEKGEEIAYFPSYSKTINENIKYSDIKINKCELINNYLIVQITIEDIFTDNDKNINIVVHNTTK